MTNTIIIGASVAGLACAGALTKKKIPYLIFEKEAQIAPRWRKHYDRLHIHTTKYNSHLPYFRFPSSYPIYPSKDQLIVYYETYREKFNIQPNFQEAVLKIEQRNGLWHIQTIKEQYTAQNVILATGLSAHPYTPDFEGLEVFQGQKMHSADYKNADTLRGKQVLVVGFGNSACEIALDLQEQGASSWMSVRGPVNIVPRDINGIPASLLGYFTSWLPPRIQDQLNTSTLQKIVGDLRPYGLQPLSYGPAVQVGIHGQAPAVDIGTLDLIKAGKIKILPAIKAFSKHTIHFVNSVEQPFDMVIFATGFQPRLSDWVSGVDGIVNEWSKPQQPIRSELEGLYYCGFQPALNGMLRGIRKEAVQIARWIVKNMP